MKKKKYLEKKEKEKKKKKREWRGNQGGLKKNKEPF